MKKIICFLALLLGLSTASAQEIYLPLGTGYVTEYADILRQPLAVVLPEETTDDKILKKLGKQPGSLEAYRADIAAQRAALAGAAKCWQGGPVTYIHAAEVIPLLDDKEQPHLVLQFGYVNVDGGPRAYTKFGDANASRTVVPVPALELRWLGKVAKVGVGGGLLAMAGGNGAPSSNSRLAAYQIFYYGFDSRWSQVYHTSDFIGTMQQMQGFMAQRAAGKSYKEIGADLRSQVSNNAALLPGKTLLLDRDQLSDNFPESKISQVYPYPVQVTDRATLEAAVAAADPRYLYVRYITVEHNNGYQLIDASTGHLVSYAEYHLLRPTDLGRVQDFNLKEMVKNTR